MTFLDRLLQGETFDYIETEMEDISPRLREETLGRELIDPSICSLITFNRSVYEIFVPRRF
jgi:hypothetical protein